MKKKTKEAPRRPGRLSAEEMAELPDRLLDAALAEFNAHGFGDTTMEKIARRAGASTKTLYSRYDNKAALLNGVVERIIRRALASHAAATSVDPRNVKPEIFLNSLGTKIVTGVSTEGIGLIQLAFAEAKRNPQLAAMYNGTLAGGRAIFRGALEAWQAQGLLPDLKDSERAAGLCISMITDGARIRAAMGQPFSAAEIEAHVPYAVNLFLRGCGYKNI
jgi:AcrR family transcriptional regulator